MMGCFLPCFCASKRRRHVHSSNTTRSGDQTHVADGDLKSTELTEQNIIEEPKNDTQSKKKFEEQSNNSDLNANANEELSTKELIIKLEESNIKPEKASKEAGAEINDRLKSIGLSRPSNPPDYRHRDCSDDENLDEGDFGGTFIADNLEDEKKGENEEDGQVNRKSLEEESSESLFSLSVDSRKQVSATEKAAEKEVNSSMPIRGAVCGTKEEYETSGSSHSTHGVQKASSRPSHIANLARGKPIQATGIQSSKNINLFRIKLEGPSNCEAKRKVNFDLNLSTNESSAKEEQDKAAEEETPLISECPKSIAPGKSSYPSHYRYRGCSEEECGDSNLDGSDFGDTFVDNDPDNEERGEGEEGRELNRTWVQEESSESLFSISTGSRKQVSAAKKAEHEVNSPMPARGTVSSTEEEAEAFGFSQSSRARIQNVSSVLSPIENHTQGKAVKATVKQPSKYEKENINSEQDVDIHSPELSLKLSNGKARQKFNDAKREIGVDTSLSSWLVETETTPKSKSSTNSVGDSTPKGGRISPVSHEDRPILGALTIEELRKFSVSTCSRRSRSRSPDETPIIGTVGSYWSHTGQTINSDSSSSCSRMPKAGSKSREDAKVKWNSTPFKARLEGAFEASVHQF